MRLPVTPPLAPMLAKPVAAIPPGQLYEPKWDGFRAIVFRDGDEVEIGSRNGRTITRYFPELVAAIRAALPRRCVVDGEIVVPGADQGLDFWALQQRIHPAARRIRQLAEETPASLIAKAPDLVYQPDKRVMSKVKHVRTADCVVAGYRNHRTAPDAVGSLLLGLYDDGDEPTIPEPFRGGAEDRSDGPSLISVGVVGAFPMAVRRRLVEDLRPLVTDLADHPWSWAADEVADRARRGQGTRWNGRADMSFVPLRPERVVEVRYDYMEGFRFRHTTQFVRWRPDRDPASCTYAQLQRPEPFDLGAVLAGAGPLP